MRNVCLGQIILFKNITRVTKYFIRNRVKTSNSFTASLNKLTVYPAEITICNCQVSKKVTANLIYNLNI